MFSSTVANTLIKTGKDAIEAFESLNAQLKACENGSLFVFQGMKYPAEIGVPILKGLIQYQSIRLSQLEGAIKSMNESMANETAMLKDLLKMQKTESV